MIRRIAKFFLGLLPGETQERVRHAIISKRELQGVAPLAPAGEKPQCIVTLTSYRERLYQSAPYALISLLKQDNPPDRIILWLGTNAKIPAALKRLQRYGVEIKLREDIGVYTKFFYALTEYPDEILVTADDDICYPPDWLSKLKAAHRQDPKAIVCHRAHEIRFDQNGVIEPYKKWKFCVPETEHPRRLFPTTGGGVLYPPGSFTKEIKELQSLQTLATHSDDVGFWAMARLSGCYFKLVEQPITNIAEMALANDTPGRYLENLNGSVNDTWIERCLEAYPELYELIR